MARIRNYLELDNAAGNNANGMDRATHSKSSSVNRVVEGGKRNGIDQRLTEEQSREVVQ